MKSILVPSDFTSNSKLTLEYAIQFTRDKNCKLVLFHAFYDPNILQVDDIEKSSLMELEVGKMIQKMKDDVNEVCNDLKIQPAVINFEFIVSFGKDTVELINKTVSEKNIHLIIIGTRGVKGFISYLMQSHTIKLIASAKVPLLVIPIGYSYRSIKNIFYATDLIDTQRELAKLVELNLLFNSELKIVYFDNGISKTSTELKNLRLIEISGLKFNSIQFNIGTNMMEHLTDFLRYKKHSIACLFHSQKSRLLTIIVGSNTNELVSHLKFPILSINKE